MSHGTVAVAAGIVTGGGAALLTRSVAPGRRGLAVRVGVALGAAAAAVAVAPSLRSAPTPTLAP